jgi:hypothetical protein
MDNNFSNILDIFKRLDESAIKHMLELFNDWMNSEDCPLKDMAGNDRAVMGCAYRYLDGRVDPSKIDVYAELLTKKYHGGMEEGSMAVAERHSTGPKFTGYWKGTDAGTPGKHMVGGGTAESAEEYDEPMTLTDKLKARWEKTKQEKGISEAGADNPAQGSQNPQAELAKQTAAVQKGVNALKNAGAPMASVLQTVKTTLKDPTKDQLNTQDKQVDLGLGQNVVQKIIKTGDPGMQNQLAALVRKANQSKPGTV